MHILGDSRERSCGQEEPEEDSAVGCVEEVLRPSTSVSSICTHAYRDI